MHQRHSPAGVMRRHRTTAMPFGIERVQTLWVRTMIFFILPLRGKHDSTRERDCAGPEHRHVSVRNGGQRQMLLLWLSAKGEAPTLAWPSFSGST
jgi:hypothetical protein